MTMEQIDFDRPNILIILRDDPLRNKWEDGVCQDQGVKLFVDDGGLNALNILLPAFAEFGIRRKQQVIEWIFRTTHRAKIFGLTGIIERFLVFEEKRHDDRW